jgi:hypothetical protein
LQASSPTCQLTRCKKQGLDHALNRECRFPHETEETQFFGHYRLLVLGL